MPWSSAAGFRDDPLELVAVEPPRHDAFGHLGPVAVRHVHVPARVKKARFGEIGWRMVEERADAPLNNATFGPP